MSMARLCLLIVALIVTAASVHAADSRLAQNITYQGGYKRLHTIAEELTKQTGVTIRAGSNRQDWRVRDIPLIVCVKDMPLGMLLKSMATCAHITLAIDKGTTTSDRKPTYRLYRTKEQEDEVSNNLSARVEANRKLALWAWDTLTAYARMPDASSEIRPSKGELTRVSMTRTGQIFENTAAVDAANIRKLAEALASLGSDARAKFAAGDEINLWCRDNSVVTALYDYVVAQQTTLQPTDLEREEAYFAVKMLRQETKSDSAVFQCQLYGIPTGEDESSRYTTYWNVAPVQSARALAAVDRLHLPKPPDITSAFASEDSIPGFIHLAQDSDYSIEPLQSSITLHLSKPSSYWHTRAELLAALCKAGGLNVICEDFVSQKLPQHWCLPDAIKDAGTPGALLKAIAQRKDTSWFVEPESRLIIGWADNWRKHHSALVEESLLTGIRTKRESRSGAELDDVVGLWELSTDQFAEWIDETPDYIGINCSGGTPTAMWRIYNRLSHNDKALARSADGLPLAKLSIPWVMNVYSATKKGSEDQQLAGWCSEQEPHTKLRKQYFSNPDLVSKLVLFVDSEPRESWLSWDKSDPNASSPQVYTTQPDGPKRHTYQIRLADTTLEDDQLNLRTTWNVVFPLFTPEREAEFIKKVEMRQTK